MPDIWPLPVENAVHNGVADTTVTARLVVTDYAILPGSKCFDSTLRREIKVVCSQANDSAAESVKRMAEKEQLAYRVDGRALVAFRIPGVADFHAVDIGNNVVVSGRADNRSGLQFAHNPWQHVAVALPLESAEPVPVR